MENWKDINNYKDFYQISDFGRVKSLRREVITKKGVYRYLEEKILIPLKNPNGYLSIELSKNNIKERFAIHRLVAEAFITNHENKPEVNHKDCNKKNNNASYKT
jgi:hypothetical protein